MAAHPLRRCSASITFGMASRLRVIGVPPSQCTKNSVRRLRATVSGEPFRGLAPQVCQLMIWRLTWMVPLRLVSGEGAAQEAHD